MSTRKSPADPPTEYESVRGVSGRTGYSQFFIRELIAEGKLPAYRVSDKPGSTIRVKRSDVDNLFQRLIPAKIYADSDGGSE